MQVRSVNQGQKAGSFPIPAPIGGLNARDALAAMPPSDASVMVNMFPYADRVDTRGGFSVQATASSISQAGTVEGFRRLARHVSMSGTEALFAAFFYWEDVAGTDYSRLRIYSVNGAVLTTAVEVVTAASTDYLEAIGEWTQFTSGSGSSYLIWPMSIRAAGPTLSTIFHAYTGAAWSTLAITGLPGIVQGIHAHRNRLWFYNCRTTSTGGSTLEAYYLPTGAVAGAAIKFDIGPYATKGGRIIAMRTWARDGGDGGLDDVAAFITSEGQAILYGGIDPSSAATWQLIGVFDFGRIAPWNGSNFQSFGDQYGLLVRDAYAIKYGSDVLLNTQSGLTSLARVTAGGDQAQDFTISTKIRPLLVEEAERGPTSLAIWQITHVPTLSRLIISIPQSSTDTVSTTTLRRWTSTWYVMNTDTGAWTTFTGLNSLDSLVLGGAMYFVDGGLSIYFYDNSGADDNGTAITFECRQAYNYFNSPVNKLVTLMQPMLRATGNFSLTVRADADFKGDTISSYTSYTVSGTPNVQPWLSPSKYGRAIATHLKGQTSTGVVSWYATNYLAQSAGPL